MSRTRDQPEKLGARQKEVENLWEEEEEESLGEMSLDADYGEGHPGEVTKGISWESSSRVPSHTARRQSETAHPSTRFAPIVIQKAGTNSQQRQHEIEAEQVPLHEHPTSMSHSCTPHTPNPDFAADIALISQQV